MTGDSYAAKRVSHSDVSAQSQVLAATSGVVALIANRANYKTYIQRILVNVTTSAAQTATFRANTTETVILGVVPSSPDIGVLAFDFGADGWALPDGEGLECALSAAGLAFAVVVEAYQQLIPGAAVSVETAAGA